MFEVIKKSSDSLTIIPQYQNIVEFFLQIFARIINSNSLKCVTDVTVSLLNSMNHIIFIQKLIWVTTV